MLDQHRLRRVPVGGDRGDEAIVLGMQIGDDRIRIRHMAAGQAVVGGLRDTGHPIGIAVAEAGSVGLDAHQGSPVVDVRIEASTDALSRGRCPGRLRSDVHPCAG